MSDRTHHAITLIGLGPGDPLQLTREAWEIINGAPELYLRTVQHPTVSGLPSGLKIHSFDQLYDDGQSFEEVYEKIVARVVELGQRPQGVIYAVPGHPFVAEATCPEIVRRADQVGLSYRVVEGISFLEPAFTALKIDPFPRLATYDALALAAVHHSPIAPDMPVLIAQLYSRQLAAEVKITLMTIYPDDHNVTLVHAAGTPAQKVQDIPLYEIDRVADIGLLTSLYVPSLDEASSFESFQEVVARLRAPDGCPWDREQTHQTLRTPLLQEAYETLDAIDRDDPEKMCEEFGDLLLQIVLNAQIASEDGEYSMVDVLRGINQKIIRRHPHVFATTQVDGVAAVLKNWEQIKAEERKENGEKNKGILDSVPQVLPALNQAQEYQARAARVGFDWPEVQGVIEKVFEELEEIRTAPDAEARANEIGDLLFAVVNLARWYKVDAESALREMNSRFRRRFAYIERTVSERKQAMSDLPLSELDVLWEEAKKLE